MVPDTVASLLAFFLLVAPGIVFQLLRERWFPKVDETAFRELSVVVLASALFSSLGLAIVALIRAVEPQWVVNVGGWLHTGDPYFNAHYRLVVRTLLVAVFVALVAAVVVAFLVRWLGRGGTVKSYNMWHSVFSKGAYAPTETSSVCVMLIDGIRYFGVVEQWSDEAASWEERELLLRKPLSVQPRGAPTAVPLDATWQRVVVRGNQIRDILVTYY